MTDNELIKVQEEALRVAKETINRQKAEIAELQSELIITKNNFDNAKDRYDETVKIGQKMNEKLINSYKKLKTAKSEAYKEFAERLQEETGRFPMQLSNSILLKREKIWTQSDINRTLTELTGK